MENKVNMENRFEGCEWLIRSLLCDKRFEIIRNGYILDK